MHFKLNSMNLLCLSLAILLAGCTSKQKANTDFTTSSVIKEEQLGTAWGENIESKVVSVEANRLSDHPTSMANIYYKGGIESSGARFNNFVKLGEVGMRIQNENGKDIKIFRKTQNDYQLFALDGERYALKFNNNSRTVAYEVLATVDGLNVLTGKRGSIAQRGYLLYPGESMLIEGFRKSDVAVAAFRFAKPTDSYAANSVDGDASNVGVIGVATFAIALEQQPKCKPQAWPDTSRYAQPPCYK